MVAIPLLLNLAGCRAFEASSDSVAERCCSTTGAGVCCGGAIDVWRWARAVAAVGVGGGVC